jgi:hypothetical protein
MRRTSEGFGRATHIAWKVPVLRPCGSEARWRELARVLIEDVFPVVSPARSATRMMFSSAATRGATRKSLARDGWSRTKTPQ